MEREFLFGNSLRLPSGGLPSSCELELLKLLREVDLAFLEKQRTLRAKQEKAEAVIKQRDAELQQAREEISQLRDQIQYLESFQGDLVNKYDKRIGDLKNDVVKIKKRYCSLKSTSERGALQDEVEIWKAKAAELDKQLKQVVDDVGPRLREQREQKMKTAVAEKEAVIDRLSERVLELTRRVRELESTQSSTDFMQDGEKLIEEAMRTFELRRSEIESQQLHRRIRGHIKDMMAKFKSDRDSLQA